jgi:hypothetical protein
MTLHQVRTGALIVLLIAVALAVYKRRAVVHAVKEFFLEPSYAINLALLRVVLFSMIFLGTNVGDCAFYSRLPRELMSTLPGWGWLMPVLPLDPATSDALEWIVLVASALAIVGLFTRIAVPVAALVSIYTGGIANFYFKINHGNHAIVLCALVLAVSPCGDALSLDRLWQRYRGYAAPSAGVEYTLPVRFCWLIFGTVYLFPGICKLWDSGDLWLNGKQLKTLLYAAWGGRPNFVPLARIDEWPHALQILGFATIFFEIVVFFALFNRTTRIIGAFSAIGFHLGTGAFMAIHFHPFLPLILLFDFPGIARWLEAHVPGVARAAERFAAWSLAAGASVRAGLARALPAPDQLRALPRRAVLPALVVGSLLLGGQFFTGFRKIDSWPLSIHPRFSARRPKASTRASGTKIVVKTTDGETKDVTHELGAMGVPRLSRLLNEVKSGHGGSKRSKKSRMLAKLVINQGIPRAPGDRLIIYSENWDIFPIGEQANYRRSKVKYVVTDDMELERDDKHKGKKKKKEKAS